MVEMDNSSNAGAQPNGSGCGIGKLPLETRIYVNGEFIKPTGKRSWDNINPATEETILNITEASAEEVEMAVQAARVAFDSWSATSGKTRRDLLLKLADLIEQHKEQLAGLESLDNGKPVSVAIAADLRLVVETYRYYAGYADKLQGKTIPIKAHGADDKQFLCFTLHEPVGVVAQIIPWNFPLLMMAWKLAPALAVGCTIVLKTSEKTPLSALMLAHLIHQAGFPKGVVNILTGWGDTVGSQLTRHPAIDKVCFTGSTQSGKKVLIAAAESGMKRTTLELGGKSPLIVFEDADLDTAANIAHFGLFFNMGQCCIASSRVFVHEDVHDAFIAKLSKIAKGAVMGPPDAATSTQGPQVDKIQYDKIVNYIETGKAEGAKCIAGGSKWNSKGYFVEPTVFCDVTDEMTIAKEEIFGPVITVLKFKTLEEAVERANATFYGLGAGVCSKSLSTSMKVAQRLKAGTVYVNCWNVFDPAAPFGGFKQSGQGRELGEYGLQPYTEVKTVIADLNA